MRHRFPNTEGETESRVLGALCRTRTLLTLYITMTTWDKKAVEIVPPFPEVSPAKSEFRFIKMVSYSMVKLCAPHYWLRLCAFHSDLWQPNWWMTQFTMMEMGGIFL